MQCYRKGREENMRYSRVLSAVVLLLFVMCACSQKVSNSSSDAESNSDINSTSEEISEVSQIFYDPENTIDLTKMSTTMAYAEICNMVESPQNYAGKNVIMEGSFMAYLNYAINEYYFVCMMTDATACCAQGLKFVTEMPYSYPYDCPKDGDKIKVQGIFDVYEENGNTLFQLINATMDFQET